MDAIPKIEAAEPVAWRRPLRDGSGNVKSWEITHKKSIAVLWAKEDFPVSPLYTANPTPEQGRAGDVGAVK